MRHPGVKKFGRRVRELRTKAGFSQERLAELAGLHRTYVGGIERGLVPPISHLGTLVPVMAGVALAGRMQAKNLVALTYLGDGATSTGDFHEGLGIASVMYLPAASRIPTTTLALCTSIATYLSLFIGLSFRYQVVGLATTTFYH